MSRQSARTIRLDGSKVIRLRQERGWDREDLAKKSGCSPKNVERIEAGGVVAVLPATAGFLAEALGVPITDLLAPGEPPAAEGLAAGTAADLAVHVEVRVWGGAGEKRRGLSLGQPGALPVRAGDKVRIEVEVSPRSYLYVVWVTSDGVGQPLYPWTPGDWNSRTAAERVNWLSLPVPEAKGHYGGWPIDTPAGVETLVVLARADKPLSEDFLSELAGEFNDFPRGAAAPDPGRGVLFSLRRKDGGRADGRRLKFPAEPVHDPIYAIQSLLRDRLADRFDLVHAVSLANAGNEGGTP
jgi:transcriptional regulator with XRE-family HTH domain